jgi:hypothetical protein
MEQEDMLLNEIVPENAVALTRLGYNTIPYNQFLPYKSIFENTLKRNE